MSTTTRTAFAALLLFEAACSVKETPAPPLTGPSEFALRLALEATPDNILQDGVSQSVILIEAAGPDGRPIRNLSLRADIIFKGIIQDFGRLSTKNPITGEDGRTRVTYTSPPRPSEAVETYNVVIIRMTPIGGDFGEEFTRTVNVRLVTPGIVGPPPPPTYLPRPNFEFSPTAPEVRANVLFDASTTEDDTGGTAADGSPAFGPCGAGCTYSWDFGDGTTATGIFVTHQFQRISNYQVRLTVTDKSGLSASVAKPVQVGAGQLPTASFVFSPTSPVISQTISFNASASRAAPGRSIVSYDWDFGSGRTGNGVTVSKGYESPGTYQVTLTVTDDTSLTASVTQSVTVSLVGDLAAAVTVSPSGGTTNTTFFFDASASRQGASRIVEYRFTFGDNTPDVVGASPTTSHRYTIAGTYTARVMVKDAAGRTATQTASVSVQNPQ